MASVSTPQRVQTQAGFHVVPHDATGEGPAAALGHANRLSTGESVDYVLVSEASSMVFDDSNMEEGPDAGLEELLYTARSVPELRDRFEAALVSVLGMTVERQYSHDRKYVYTLVHSPEQTLYVQAEKLRMACKLDRAQVERLEGGKFKGFLSGNLKKKFDGALNKDRTAPTLLKVMTGGCCSGLSRGNGIMEDTIAALERDPFAFDFQPKDGWERHTSDAGDDYFFNRHNGESRWCKAIENEAIDCQYYFQSRFMVQNKELFANVDNPDRFFTPAQRIELTYILLRQGLYDESMGISYLLDPDIGVYVDGFALHDGLLPPKKARNAELQTTEADDDVEQGAGAEIMDGQTKTFPLVEPGECRLRSRASLQRRWGKIGTMFQMQPHDEICRYFGSRAGLYFLMLDVYNSFLWLPAMLGILVFIYGLITLGIHTADEKEVCNANVSEYTMGAACTVCKPLPLEDSCGAYKAASIFDNESTPIYAFIMVIWVSLFSEFWKRILTFRTFKMAARDSPGHQRPQYIGHPGWYDQWVRKPSEGESVQLTETQAVKDRSTDLLAGISHEAQLPCNVRACRNPALPGSVPAGPDSIGTQTCAKHKAWTREERRRVYTGTLSISIVFILCAIAFFFSIIVYRLAARAALSRNDNERVAANANLIASLTASFIDIAAMVTLNKLYRKVAIKLTAWENHRTQEEHEASLCTKVFIFEFITYNATLLYLSFLKGNFYGFPGDYAELGDSGALRFESCPIYGCRLDVTIQLIVIMVGKSQVQNILEYFYPWVVYAVKKCCCKSKSQKVDPTRVAPWERDHRTLPPVQADLNLYDDYREIMLQLSFMSLYAPAFVLAPVFSLFNNLFEVRIDATKMLVHQRRPNCQSSNNIGIWHNFIVAISWLSVIVNGALLAFTSTLVPLVVYRWRYYESVPGSLDGYIDRMFPVSNKSISECIAELGMVNTTEQDLLANNTFASVTGYDCFPTRFQSTRESDGERGQFFFHVIFARLAYFIVFEHLAFLVKFFILFIVRRIPDVVRKMQVVEEHLHDSLLLKYNSDHPAHDSREVGADAAAASAVAADSSSSSGGGSKWSILRQRHAAESKAAKGSTLLWPSMEQLKLATTNGEAAQAYFQQFKSSIV